jgi:hypothetical protein
MSLCIYKTSLRVYKAEDLFELFQKFQHAIE